METKYLEVNHADLSLAGGYLRQGKLVAFPTDIMYAMGVSVYNDSAIERLYTAKGCSTNTPLVVHVWNKQQVAEIAKLTPDAELVLDKLMPSNLTLLLPKKGTMSVYVTGRLAHVAIRMPQCNECRKFLQYAEIPVASIGASLQGHAHPTSWRKVKAELDSNVSAVVCGNDCDRNQQSTILDLCHDTPKVLYQGDVTVEQISQVLGKPVEEVNDVKQVVTILGGRLKNFRAEKVQMVLHVGGTPTKLCAYYDSLAAQGYNPVLLVPTDPAPFGNRHVHCFGDDPNDIALRLLDNLRVLEKRYNFIIASLDSKTSQAYNILSKLSRV